MNIRLHIWKAAYTTLAASLCIVPASNAAADRLPFYEVTANGSWDCRDPAGTLLGTVVLAEETYAFMHPDGRLGGYGKLRLLSFDTQVPNLAVLSGYLKERYNAGGMGITGPREDYEDISGELFLTVAVSTDRAESWYCKARAPSQAG